MGTRLYLAEAPRRHVLDQDSTYNLQLAVARVLKTSEDGDESDFAHAYIASPDFCNILTAKLFLGSTPGAG
jgi:hypothetical protein